MRIAQTAMWLFGAEVPFATGKTAFRRVESASETGDDCGATILSV
jgi:hypothetical protein